MIKHLSYSSVKLYLDCPYAWYHRYVLKTEVPLSPALVFGSTFHLTIEDHLRNRSDPPSSIWVRRWEKAGKSLGEYEELSTLGKTMLSNPDTLKILKNIHPVEIEKKIEFRVPGVPVPVIGYIDVILSDGTLGDFKTSSKPWEKNWAEREEQPSFYLTATGGTRFIHYVFPKLLDHGVQVIETQRTGSKGHAHSLVKQAWDGIKAERFDCHPDNWRCKGGWCEYEKFCNKGREVY